MSVSSFRGSPRRSFILTSRVVDHVSDLHVCLKVDEIRMFVMCRMNREFMEYMRTTYPHTPLSEFKEADTYVRANVIVDDLEDEEDDE